MKEINEKALTIIIIVVYIIQYIYVYEHFVIGIYGYMNLSYSKLNSLDLTTLVIIVCLPIYFYKGLINVSSALSALTYIFVYIPFAVTLYTCKIPNGIKAEYVIILIAMMCLFFKTDNRVILSNIQKKRIGRRGIKIEYIEVFTLLLLTLVVVSEFKNIKYINILTQADKMYELRSENNSTRNTIISYITLWLSHSLIPILSTCYYRRGQKIKFWISLIVFILLFMVDMQKITFVMPFVTLGLLYYSKRYQSSLRKYFLPGILITIGIISQISFILYSNNVLFLSLATLIILRTQTISGQALERYLSFFEIEQNPYTKYSHVNIINSITDNYPYGESSIGQVVAGDGTNFNATFLLMDGIAAYGLIGTIISGIAFILFKMALNSLSTRYKNFDVLTICLFGIFSFINTSLFTSIFSFGFLITYTILTFSNLPIGKR